MDRENSVTKLCPVGRGTQPLTPTNTRTISLPGLYFSFHHFMHLDNELVEFVTADEQEYEEIIEEYEEEILVQEGASEPPVTDFADTPPAQGKPRCITLILNNH